MNDQQQSRADALTEAQRRTLQSALDLFVAMGHSPESDHVRTLSAMLAASHVEQPAAAPIDGTLAFESALSELVNKIDSGLDTGDLLADARMASAALDVILSRGDLVANAHDFFKSAPGRYEDSVEFRIGWNACLDAIERARASTPKRAPAPADERAAPDVPEKRHATDPEQQWQQFWREICTNADGSINLEQVKKELSDFSMLLSWVPRVYMHVTGGKVSKENTWPSVVISLHDEHVNELVEEAVRSELEARAASANETGAEGVPFTMALNPNAPPLTMTLGPAQAAKPMPAPAGWKLVPVAPTFEMCRAMEEAIDAGWKDSIVWARGIAAAPQPPAQAAKRVDAKARMDWAESILKNLPETEPTYSIIKLLNDYDQDERDEILQSIRAYADCRATQALFTQYPAAQADAQSDKG